MEPHVDDPGGPWQPPTPGAALAPAASVTTPASAPIPPPTSAPTIPTREPLTRVPVDLSKRRIEPAIDWCRHEVRRIVAWHLIATAVVVLAVVVPLCWWQFESPTTAISIGVLAAVVVVAARIGFVLVAGPLGFGYVKTFTSAPPEYLLAHQPSATPTNTDPSTTGPDLWDLDPNEVFVEAPPTLLAPDRAPPDPDDVLHPVDDDPDPERRAAIADVLREMGFAPVTTVRADGRAGAVVDLFSDGDRIVAAVERTSGGVTLLTELAGFRVLITSALLVPPTDELVVNVVDDADPAGLVLSHQRLVKQAFRARTRVSEPVGLFKLAQQRELEAYRELGPFWGAMLDLRCRPRGARLAAAPSAGDVLLFTGNRLFQHTP